MIVRAPHAASEQFPRVCKDTSRDAPSYVNDVYDICAIEQIAVVTQKSPWLAQPIFDYEDFTIHLGEFLCLNEKQFCAPES